MQKEFSFYSERLKRELSGSYSVFGPLITVTSPDGRQKITQVGSRGSPEGLDSLARILLRELAVEEDKNN
jgi:hypothetical protein